MRRRSGRAGALLLVFVLIFSPLQSYAAAETGEEQVFMPVDEDTDTVAEADAEASAETETEKTDEPEKEETEVPDEAPDAVESDEQENESAPEAEQNIEWYQDNLQGVSVKVEGESLQAEPQMLVVPEYGGMFIDPKLYGIKAFVDGNEAAVAIASVVDSDGNELQPEELEEYGWVIPYEKLVHEEVYRVFYEAVGNGSTVSKDFTAFLQLDQAYDETDLDPNVQIISGGMDFGNTYHTLVFNDKAELSSWMKCTDCAKMTNKGDRIEYMITSAAAKNNIGFDLKKILYDPFLMKYYDLHITVEDYGYSKGSSKYQGGYPSLEMKANGEIIFDEKGPTIALRYQILDSETGQESPGDYIFSFWGVNRNQKFFFDTSSVVDGVYQTKDSYVDIYTNYPVLNGAYQADLYFTSSETENYYSDSAVCATVRQTASIVYGIVGTNERGSVYYQAEGTKNQRYTSLSFCPIAGAKEPVLKKGVSLEPITAENFQKILEKSADYTSEEPLLLKYEQPCYYAFQFDMPSAEDYRYSSYVITDELPEGMSYTTESVVIYDTAVNLGTDVTDLFEIKEQEGVLQLIYQPQTDSTSGLANSCYLAVFETKPKSGLRIGSVCNQGTLESTNTNGKYSFSYQVDSNEVYTKLDLDSIPDEKLKEWLDPLPGCDYQEFKAHYTEEEWKLLVEKIGFDEAEFYAQETCHTLQLKTADGKILMVTINATKKALSQQSQVWGEMMSEDELANWSLDGKQILAGIKLRILKPCKETTLEGNQIQVHVEGTKYLTNRSYDAEKLEIYEAEDVPQQLDAETGSNDIRFESGALTFLFAVPDEPSGEEALQIYLTAKDNGNETVDLDWSSYNGLYTDLFRAFDSENEGTDWKAVQLTDDVMNTDGGSGSVTMSDLFNGWSRVGAAGEWGLKSHEGTTVLVNTQNTSYFTGFYNPEAKLKKAVSWNIHYKSKNYDTDNDIIGCLIKFNLANGSTDAQNGTTKVCSTYMFLQDAGGWGNIGGIYRMDQKKMSEVKQVTSLTLIGTIKDTYGSDKSWTRNRWSSYEIICTEENEFFVYQDGVLICHCQDTSDQAIQMGTFGLINLSQPAYFKDFEYSYTRYLDRTDATVIAEDFAAPDLPKLMGSKLSVMEIAAKDNGTPYSYLVKAYGEEDLATVKIASNTPDLTITQGVRGYYYYLDDQPVGTVQVQHSYSEGASLLFDVQKDNPDGYRYLHVAAMDASTNNNLGPTADFELKQYTIHTEAEHGTITGNITGTMYFDAVISYEAEDGYQLSEIWVDGDPVKIDPYVDSYEFSDVTEDHTIKVIYSEPELAKKVSYQDDDRSVSDQVLVDGDQITYTLSYKNTTNSTRTMIVTDTIPDGMELLPESLKEIADGISVEQKDRQLKWTISRVKAKEEGSVSFSVRLLPEAQGKELKNAASLTSCALNNSHSEQDVTVISNEITNAVLADPVKDVLKEDGKSVLNQIVNAGDRLTYQIIFTNPSSLQKVFTVTDVLPEGIAYLACSDGGSYDEETRTITWALRLDGQKSVQLTIAAEVLQAAKGNTVCNKALVKVDESEKETRAPLEADKDRFPDGVPVYVLDDPEKAVLNIQGNAIDGVVKKAGDLLTYEITFANPAPEERTFIIRDILPEQVEFLMAGQQLKEDTDGNVRYKYDKDSREVTWTAQIAGDSESTVYAHVKILEDGKDCILYNHALVSCDSAVMETNEVSTPVMKDPVETIQKDGQHVENGILSVGDQVTYSVIFKNPAKVEKEAVVRLILPKGVDYMESLGTYQAEDRTITWTIPKAEPQEYTQVDVQVKINSSGKDSVLRSTAEVTIDEATLPALALAGYDGEEPLSSDQEGTSVYVSAKHSYDTKEKQIDKRTVMTGDTIRYGITYGNTGIAVQDLIIRDTLPAGVTFVQASAGGSYEEKTRVVTWKLSPEAEEQGEVFVTVKINADCGSRITNRASLEMTDPLTGRQSESEVKTENPVTRPSSKKKHSGENTVTYVPSMLLPLTGDDQHMLLYAMLFVFAMCGAAALLYWRKRK